MKKENKLSDFVEGSVWECGNGFKLDFHSFDPEDGLPLFTCKESHPYHEFSGEATRRPKGTIGFLFAWKTFKRLK